MTVGHKTQVTLSRADLFDLAARLRTLARVVCIKGTFPLEDPRQEHPGAALFALADEIADMARLP